MAIGHVGQSTDHRAGYSLNVNAASWISLTPIGINCAARYSVIEGKRTKARFFEPMLLLATTSLPEGEHWQYELKLDGYRAITFKSNGRVHVRSRNNKDFAFTRR